MPEPTLANKPIDWINEAIQYAVHPEYSTVAALIAIAQELRRMNDRADVNEEGLPLQVSAAIWGS